MKGCTDAGPRAAAAQRRGRTEAKPSAPDPKLPSKPWQKILEKAFFKPRHCSQGAMLQVSCLVTPPFAWPYILRARKKVKDRRTVHGSNFKAKFVIQRVRRSPSPSKSSDPRTVLATVTPPVSRLRDHLARRRNTLKPEPLRHITACSLMLLRSRLVLVSVELRFTNRLTQ